jgi:hypothetical protein
MELDELGISLEITKEDQVKIEFSFLTADTTHSKFLTLSELEDFQGRLAIAAAKLRGKLAKEATS